jgi:hypothetical protein
MSKKLAINERVGAYGYGLYQSEIDEYLASDEEWEAIKASIPNFQEIKNNNGIFLSRRPLQVKYN